MTTTWTDAITALDLETTGTDPYEDRLVSAAVVDYDDGQRVDGVEWAIDPGIPIPEEASLVHGVWEKDREYRQDHDTAVSEIVEEVQDAWAAGYTLVVFNAAFDLTMLSNLARKAGIEFEVSGPVVDPIVVDRYLDKWRKGRRTLVDQCKHYGITVGQAHTAAADAEMAAELAMVMATKWPGDLATEGLMDRQVRWARENHEGLLSWMRRQGRSTAGVKGGWPIRNR